MDLNKIHTVKSNATRAAKNAYPDGVFEIVPVDGGFKVALDLTPPDLSGGNINIVLTPKVDTPRKTTLPETKWRPLHLPPETAEEREKKARTAAVKRASKTKFTCPECNLNAWAKPDAVLGCWTCGVEMEDAG